MKIRENSHRRHEPSPSPNKTRYATCRGPALVFIEAQIKFGFIKHYRMKLKHGNVCIGIPGVKNNVKPCARSWEAPTPHFSQVSSTYTHTTRLPYKMWKRVTPRIIQPPLYFAFNAPAAPSRKSRATPVRPALECRSRYKKRVMRRGVRPKTMPVPFGSPLAYLLYFNVK